MDPEPLTELQGGPALGSSAAAKPGLRDMIGTSTCWHKSCWIIQIYDSKTCQMKRSCWSQCCQASEQPPVNPEITSPESVV